MSEWYTATALAVEDQIGKALVDRFRRGDQSAFSELFRTYRDLVYSVLYHLLPGDPELEDVVQTAFVEVFRSLDSFEGRSKLSSWITRVALHVGYHHLRRRKSRPPDYQADHGVDLELEDGSPNVDPHLAVERSEAASSVYRILESIAERKRTVFILVDLQGLDHQEVAEIVGTNLTTVRTRLFYARQEFWKKAAKDPVLAAIAPNTGPRTESGSSQKAHVHLLKDEVLE